MNLTALQNRFQQSLVKGDNSFLEDIVSTKQVSAKERLAVYQQAYRSRLIAALSENYPALQVCTGQAFERIALDYIAQCPSSYRSIRWYGNQLDDFLDKHPDYQMKPFLAELARFEWLMTRVFDAADETLLCTDDMANVPQGRWPGMRFCTHPSLQRINLSWNTVQIWQAATNGQKIDKAVKNRFDVPWILWRQDWVSRFSSLTEDEAWAIDAILDHTSFGDICEGLCQWFNEQDAGLRAASLLKGWLKAGWLTDNVSI